jgi:hypothetical protein
MTCLQCRLGLDLFDHGVCKRLVKLESDVILMTFGVGVSLEHLLQNLHRKLGRYRSTGDELVKGVGEGHSDAEQPRRLLQRHGKRRTRRTYDEPR